MRTELPKCVAMLPFDARFEHDRKQVADERAERDAVERARELLDRRDK